MRLINIILVLGFGLLHGTSGSSLLARYSRDEKDFEVVTNPHVQDQPPVCFANTNLDAFLEPYYLLTKPIATQPDTFQDIEYAKVMGVPIPTYRMKQPGR